ncbi:MAG: 2,3,4,5-tetrahydropyridine-2,6-dicarboxylate N-succinyltransferase, partial [Gammaproteobacteria bacterium]|nr:2,3,4,5-tetrahydropyridine-2,6-dicarboxylate N-succinyltransferase [Gammaproteobacteria bacterium]
MNNITLRGTIDSAWDQRATLSPDNVPAEVRLAVETAISQLDCGALRVAEKHDGRWQVNEWIKKAVLLQFRIQANQVIEGDATRYYDKIALKYATHTRAEFQHEGARVVPPATVRFGAYVAPDV